MMVFNDSLQLIEYDSHCELAFQYLTHQTIQLEIFLFIKELKHPQFMNTLDLKFTNLSHNKKYEYKVEQSQERQRFQGLNIDKKYLYSFINYQDNYFLLIRMKTIYPADIQMNSYFYTLIVNNEGMKVNLVKSKIYMNKQEFYINQIYGIDDTDLTGKKLNENQDNDCIVCISNKIDTIIMPCRHMCICVECIQSFQQIKNPQNRKCPVCRKDITNFIRLSQKQ